MTLLVEVSSACPVPVFPALASVELAGSKVASLAVLIVHQPKTDTLDL